MKYRAKIEEVGVDPAALRAAGDALLDSASDVREADREAQADTLSASRAFNGWQSGNALTDLATFWHKEFAAMFEQLSSLGNGVFEAASNYTAADQAAQTSFAPVDPEYFRGR